MTVQVQLKVQRLREHAAARDFDLGGGSLRAEGFNTQVITLWCFYIVGREILTLGEGFNTQVITLWCRYIVTRGTTRATSLFPAAEIDRDMETFCRFINDSTVRRRLRLH